MVQVSIDKENYYKIPKVDTMRPFFMSLVSSSDHWLFIGSNGGLSAGRKNAENALFPYYTDDKIIESAEYTGSKSIFSVERNGTLHVWEPFSIRNEGRYRVERNLYKHIYGHIIVFEEINHDLHLTFQYQWSTSQQYGFVRKSKLTNAGAAASVTILDGIQNIMPYGVGSSLQNQRSNLVDAYKRNELEKESGLGIFALSAIIVDKAEPSEALKANIAWSLGLDHPTYLLSSRQLDNFRKGLSIYDETDVKAERGAYFISKKITLAETETQEWMIVAEVNQSVSTLVEISTRILQDKDLKKKVQDDIHTGSRDLFQLNATGDGLQKTADGLRDTRHFANALFNVMRGGVFDNNYEINKIDFTKYLFRANKEIYTVHEKLLRDMPDQFSRTTLKSLVDKSGDRSFERLSIEYLPLKFSRRHGDPSRPWNQFSINTHHEQDGSKVLDYEGNWRDIFQNWEALAHAYPEFIDGMIFKFLNASTFDGYNPYRITKHGIDWERIEPDDPWSYIGYWGDHQIIYLLKFLEFTEKHFPNKLKSYFNKQLFVYANVPYKIKPYYDILKNPKDTIDFDHQLDANISKEALRIGSDSALLKTAEGSLVQVNLIEKILATVLAKISNFIPEGGIWMNTQRPEWNDANNALVGNGVSMVTLCYLRRFFKFLEELLIDEDTEVNLSEELLVYFHSVLNILTRYQSLLTGKINNRDRKLVMDGLGMAASNYRWQIYKQGFSSKTVKLKFSELTRFTGLCVQYLEHSIIANKRADGLYHAYNLMTLEGNEDVSISYLSEMLEGQVAVLSSGFLNSVEALSVLDNLRKSSLFREDQNSYLLYPNKNLPGFTKKNNIPTSVIEKSELLKKLVEDGNTTIVVRDVNGGYHFNGNFKNASDVSKALDKLTDSPYAHLLPANRAGVLGAFEQVFNHKTFTGRSGTFFGYEGLGSIYWHMVSKLQLAVQECCLKAVAAKESDEVVIRLLKHYYEINEGIGVHKSPALYGAFPTDPYSHTPQNKGAQQPGMTGQVKEDILSRFGELGVFVNDGMLCFNPCMLKKDEFLSQPQSFTYVNVASFWQSLSLDKGSLCFTYCQTPIVYTLAETSELEVVFKNGKVSKQNSLQLDKQMSQTIFQRTGDIVQVRASINKYMLR